MGKAAAGAYMTTKEEAYARLQRSKFRSSFHLREKDKQYVCEKGMNVIEKHARDFVRERLAPPDPVNDGKQTPMKGHPVFIAQHACAFCCRGCMHKWYHVQEHVPLTQVQQDKIVGMLMYWIEREMDNDCSLILECHNKNRQK